LSTVVNGNVEVRVYGVVQSIVIYNLNKKEMDLT
jgi:hypothetical protein